MASSAFDPAHLERASARFRALLIDLDGTLVDSAPDLAQAMNRLLAEEGLEPLDLTGLRRMVGDGVGKLVQRGFDARGRDLEGAALEAMTQRYMGLYGQAVAVETRPYPGVPETLAALEGAGIRLAVCSNKPEGACRDLLGQLGLIGHFAAVTGGDSWPEKKPHPLPLLRTLEALDVPPALAAMVGDSGPDAAAGRAAGLPVVLYDSGYGAVPAREIEADARLEDFGELPKVLARF